MTETYLIESFYSFVRNSNKLDFWNEKWRKWRKNENICVSYFLKGTKIKPQTVCGAASWLTLLFVLHSRALATFSSSTFCLASWAFCCFTSISVFRSCSSLACFSFWVLTVSTTFWMWDLTFDKICSWISATLSEAWASFASFCSFSSFSLFSLSAAISSRCCKTLSSLSEYDLASETFFSMVCALSCSAVSCLDSIESISF